MAREREREMETEFLPSPKATECALMHCGREHTVSPERERESITHTHTPSRVFTLPPHSFLYNVKMHTLA